MIDKLTGKVALYVIGAIVAVALIIIAAMGLRIHWLKQDVTRQSTTIGKLSGQVAVADANILTLKATIDRQNSSIEKLQAEKQAMDAFARESALRAKEKRVQSTNVGEPGVEGMNNFFKRLLQ